MKPPPLPYLPSLAVAAMLWPQALAVGVIPSISRESHVETEVSSMPGGYRYDYRVVNDSPAPQLSFAGVATWPAIVGYEIPLDHPSVVWGVQSPATWDHRFLSAAEYAATYGAPNPFHSLYVLQWYYTGAGVEGGAEPLEPPFVLPGPGGPSSVSPGGMVVPLGYNLVFGSSDYEPGAEGFSLMSNLSPVDGPYANLWLDAERNVGDPPLPGSSFSNGGLPFRHMPEAPAQALAALGCLGLAVWIRLRKRA